MYSHRSLLSRSNLSTLFCDEKDLGRFEERLKKEAFAPRYIPSTTLDPELEAALRETSRDLSVALRKSTIAESL